MSHRVINLRDILATSNLLDDDRVLIDWAQGIDIQVDWDGDPNDPGRFEVRCESTWTPVGRIAPSRDNEQLATSGNTQMTCVRVTRGPGNQGIQFGAKLVRIAWLQEVEPSEHEMVVERDTHYAYASGVDPSSVPWVLSEKLEGVHRLELSNIDVEHDYEMHVRLWHPDGSESCQDQDPVLRTNGGGGANAG